MRQIINKRTYDTRTATKLTEVWNRLSQMDPRYEYKAIYRKKNGEYFLYGQGGAQTLFAEVYANMCGIGERIIPMSEEDAREWVEEWASDSYENIFGNAEE